MFDPNNLLTLTLDNDSVVTRWKKNSPPGEVCVSGSQGDAPFNQHRPMRNRFVSDHTSSSSAASTLRSSLKMIAEQQHVKNDWRVVPRRLQILCGRGVERR